MKDNYLDEWYQALLSLLVSEDQSFNKSDRTGTGTKSLFGIQFRHNMSDGFPLLTTKKMHFKSIVTELLWFLTGQTNIKYLVDNDCHIWDGDAYKNYLKWAGNEPLTMEQFINKIKTDNDFTGVYGELGPIYGKQWRQWQGWMDLDGDRKGSIWYDQIQRLIHQLKTEPDSRRLMVNAWNVAELDQMVLPPCHYGFQVYTRELSGEERMELYQTGNYTNGSVKLGGVQWEHKWMDTWAPNVPKRAISLMWNQRSVDTFLGLPFNIASYGLLLCLIAKEVNMVPYQLIGNLGDVHLYNNHIDQAKEQISRTSYELPDLKLDFDYTYWDGYLVEWNKIDINNIIVEGYQSHPTIKAPLSN